MKRKTEGKTEKETGDTKVEISRGKAVEDERERQIERDRKR